MVSSQAFGELALMNFKPRLATIITHSDCDFATLTRDEFDQVLIEFKDENLMIHLLDLFKNPIFEEWTTLQLRDLY
jgi:CRP-like cAMP-binding protein